jgi:thiaminase/transcriptional activator TenA
MTFTEELRKKADPIWEASYAHPFVQGIGDGTLPKDKFIFYLKQDYLYLIDFARYFALIAARAADLNLMTGFAELLCATLKGEMDFHRGICAEFGISAKELEQTEIMPDTLNYTSYLLKSALLGTTGETLAGFMPCGWGYIEIGQRLKQKGLPDDKHYRQWIEMYASEEYDKLVARYKNMLDSYALTASDGEKKRMEEVFNISSRLEYMFWEMAWCKRCWPI